MWAILQRPLAREVVIVLQAALKDCPSWPHPIFLDISSTLPECLVENVHHALLTAVKFDLKKF